MIGLFGIIADEQVLERSKREEAFSRMMHSVDANDFHNTSITGEHFSVGLTKRNVGENKDLAIRVVREGFAAAFCGYGKFRGERRLFWAGEMINRIIRPFREEGEKAFINLEGSFEVLILFNNELIIMSDRFGTKNLFYYDTNQYFIFGPDVGRILASDLLPREKNIDGAKQVLVSGFFLDDATLAKNVYRFPFASIMRKNVLESPKSSFKRYWDMPKRDGHMGIESRDLVETFSEKLSQAIYELSDLEKRFTVPLSGGLDSRTIGCYLSKRYSIRTLTYDTKEEASIARKVCKKLNAEFHFFSNNTLLAEHFNETLKRMIIKSDMHCVVNQYFYCPLFREYFLNDSNVAIFDGIYLDELFSALTPRYDFKTYDFDKFFNTYGGRSIPMLCEIIDVDPSELKLLLEKTYFKWLEEHKGMDDAGKSQLFYVVGRLRRYVNEALCAKENYCFVMKPGFDYDLMDFGFGLKMNLRMGNLYRQMLYKEFPEVMKIRHKDSYGNRKESFGEGINRKYGSLRLMLCNASHGLIKYSPYQLNYFFIQKKRIYDYKEVFLDENYIRELMSDKSKEKLFNMSLKKYYLFNIFQRVLFVQLFFRSHNF